MVSPERWINFTVFVEVRCYGPGAMILVEEENHAFAYVDEDADVAAAPVEC